MWDRYIFAANLEEVLDLLSDQSGKIRVIAGGTDLYLELTRGLQKDISTILDVSRIPGLDRIYQNNDSEIRIGPTVTHRHVIESSLIRQYATCLAEACYQVGSPQIRNLGTIAGNLVTGSPANDTIPALVALGAELLITSRFGERRIKVQDFYSGVRKTCLGSNEFLKEIIIPITPVNSKSTFIKLGLRNAQAISVINAATWIRFEQNKVMDIKVAVGSCSPTIVRLNSLEKLLTGVSISELDTFSFGNIPFPEISPINDLRGSAAYRRDMVITLLTRCMENITEKKNRYKPLPDKPITLRAAIPSINNSSFSESIIIDQNTLIETKINGKLYKFRNAYRKNLLDLIREDGGLIGTKEGCSEGECGACTVFLNGEAVLACLVPAPRAHLTEIITIEGISQEDELHPVQKAFIQKGAVQCGYCTPGFVMSAVKLLEEVNNPNQDEIKEAISGNLCRCTGYYKIVSAIEQAACCDSR